MHQRHDVFWMELTERLWLLFWRAVGAFAVAAAIPAGVLFGLRVIGFIVPKVTP